MKRRKRILIVRPDRIGDVILATPLIREIRKKYPDSFIGALVNPYTKDILKNNPHLDMVFIDDPKDKENYLFFDQVKRLKSYKFNTGLMLLPTERHAWMLLLAGIMNRVGVGIKLYQILTLTRFVSRKKYIPLRHEADYCMDLGRKIGVTPSSLDPEIFITEKEKQEFIKLHLSNKIFDRNGARFICIHPGSNKSAPNWNIERYVQLTSLLLVDSRNIIFLTGNDNELHFVPRFKALNSDKIINFIGKLGLRELCVLISMMDILFSASTGPMHIASALKIPTVSLFCTLNACSPKLWGPMGNISSIITPPDNFCRIECTDDPHNCDFKESIPVETVQDSINKLLNNNLKIKI